MWWRHLIGTMIRFLVVSQVSNHPPLGGNGQLHMNVPLQGHLHKTRTIQYLTVLNCYIFYRIYLISLCIVFSCSSLMGNWWIMSTKTSMLSVWPLFIFLPINSYHKIWWIKGFLCKLSSCLASKVYFVILDFCFVIQCKGSMYNSDQCWAKSWHWSEIPLNANHWSAFRSATHFWSVLIALRTLTKNTWSKGAIIFYRLSVFAGRQTF